MEKVLTNKLQVPIKQDQNLLDNISKDTVPYNIDPALIKAVSVDHLTPGDQEQAIRTIKACQMAKLPIIWVPEGLHDGHGYEVNKVIMVEGFKDLDRIASCGIQETDERIEAYQILEPNQFSERLHLEGGGINQNGAVSSALVSTHGAMVSGGSTDGYPLIEGVVIIKKDDAQISGQSTTPAIKTENLNGGILNNQDDPFAASPLDLNSSDFKIYNN